MDLYGSTVILCFLSLPFGAAAPNAATGIGWLAALVLVDRLLPKPRDAQIQTKTPCIQL